MEFVSDRKITSESVEASFSSNANKIHKVRKIFYNMARNFTRKLFINEDETLPAIDHPCDYVSRNSTYFP